MDDKQLKPLGIEFYVKKEFVRSESDFRLWPLWRRQDLLSFRVSNKGDVYVDVTCPRGDVKRPATRETELREKDREMIT